MHAHGLALGSLQRTQTAERARELRGKGARPRSGDAEAMCYFAAVSFCEIFF